MITVERTRRCEVKYVFRIDLNETVMNEFYNFISGYECYESTEQAKTELTPEVIADILAGYIPEWLKGKKTNFIFANGRKCEINIVEDIEDYFNEYAYENEETEDSDTFDMDWRKA